MNINDNNSPHAGHRDRLRARFLAEGLDGFEPHNILELLLFYAIPRRDTNELAHELIARYGSLSGVLDAGFDSLTGDAGLTENAASLLKLIPPVCRAYMLDRGSEVSALDSYDKLGAYLCDYFLGAAHEYIAVLPLSANDKPSRVQIISEGSADCCRLDLRRIAELCLKSGASSFILAHNHPGASSEPSPSDLSATKAAIPVFEALGMPLREHFIVAGRNYTRCVERLLHG